ncbi:hypothetical protein Fmac_032979 [Flemingia macrophylla]|uniref:Uncharacterized protein n=1 Tax=Flemingia macrophylla TaxID=520843 RepID=A0ABD1L6W7_9FABA
MGRVEWVRKDLWSMGLDLWSRECLGIEELRGEHVAVLASFSSPAHVFEQLSVIYALFRLFVPSFTLVLPFFPTGSFEGMEEGGDVPNVVTLAWMFSNIPMSRGGPTSLVIYDIHALQDRFYFGEKVLPLFETDIPLLKQRLSQLRDVDNVVIAFPDDGAWKRFYNLFDNFVVVVCTKVGEGDKRIVRIKEGNVCGHHIKVLVAHGAAKVSAYVTHGVFPNQSWMRFTHKDDSCPLTVKAIENKAPFEVLSLAKPIANALQI